MFKKRMFAYENSEGDKGAYLFDMGKVCNGRLYNAFPWQEQGRKFMKHTSEKDIDFVTKEFVRMSDIP